VIFNLVGPFYPLRGGIAQYIGVLGQKLQEKGHRVKVLAFRKQFPRFLFPGKTQLEASKEYIHLEAEAVFIPWNPLTWYRTYRQAKAGGAQALIFNFFMPFFAPGYAAVCVLVHWFTDIRIIYIIHNVIPHEKRPGDRFFTRLAFRWVDGFIVQAEVVRQDLFKWFPQAKNKPVVYVPHPIYDTYSGSELSREEARARLNRPTAEKLLLFFGLVRRYKGLDILLEAMPEVIRSLGEVHLLIAGEFYEPEQEYRQIIEKLEIGDHVTMLNQYIPNEDVSLYFRSADVLVLPYRSATQSGVIQVAHHFAMPVISTRVGGLPEVIREGETGFLVEPEHPAALAKAIVEFFQYRNSHALKMGLESARLRYTWDDMVQAIEELAKNKVGQD
jgi:glycosyltransferase involved in cell wall biosynthesis